MKGISFSFLLFLLLYPTLVWGQSPYLDSLRKIIKNHPQKDTTYVLMLCDYAYEQKDSVFILAKKAKELSTNLKFEKGTGRAMWLLGMAYYYKDRIDSSEYYLDLALPAALHTKDIREQARIYNSKANVARYKGNTALAVDLYFKSLKLKEENKDVLGEAITLNNIANVYSDLKDYKRALPYYRKSLVLRRSINKENSATMLLSTIGDNYLQLGTMDSARYFLDRGLQFGNKDGGPWNLVYVYMGFISYYSKLGKYDSAFYFTQLGLAAAKQVNKEKESIFLLQWAKHSLRLKKYGEALQLADTVLAIRPAATKQEHVIDGLEMKSLALAGLKRFQEAYEVSLLFKSLSDSFRREDYERTLKSKELEYQLENEKANSDKARIRFERDINQSRWVVAFSALAIVAVSLLALFYYRNNKNKQKTNRALEQKQEEIELKNKEILAQNEELLQQKEEIHSINEKLEMSVQERTRELFEAVKDLTSQNSDLEQFSFIVSHNIRAPIARIQGLLNLIPSATPAELGKLHQLIRQSCDHLDEVIKDLSHIINIRKNSSYAKEDVNLLALVQHVLRAFQADLDNVNAEHVEIAIADDFTLQTIRPYLNSIIHNLISNAIKYRSADRNLKLKIGAEIVGDDMVLTVFDNGLGIDMRAGAQKKIFGLYQRFHTNIEGKGFGLYLVKTQLESMGGSITVQSELNSGTTFTLSIPILD